LTGSSPSSERRSALIGTSSSTSTAPPSPAATRPTIPNPGFDRLRVWVPQRQRVRVKQSGEFDRVEWIKPWRVFPEELVETPDRFVFYVPSSSVYELLTAGILTPEGMAVWSLWGGYLHQPSGKKLAAVLDEADVPLRSLHTSGHASVADLRRLTEAIEPEAVVPIHSEATHRFAELFDDVQPHPDGEWWEV
jgi:ribonuclease J